MSAPASMASSIRNSGRLAMPKPARAASARMVWRFAAKPILRRMIARVLCPFFQIPFDQRAAYREGWQPFGLATNGRGKSAIFLNVSSESATSSMRTTRSYPTSMSEILRSASVISIVTLGYLVLKPMRAGPSTAVAMSGVCDKHNAGFGWLDLIDYARLQPGLVVRMPEHRNDIHLSADGSIDLPTVPSFDRWLYIFRDAVSVRDNQADSHTALTISAHQTVFEVTASREADIILFLVKQQAPFSRAATLSG